MVNVVGMNFQEKKDMIRKLLDENGFNDIMIDRKIGSKGNAYTSKKYSGMGAIILIYSAEEK